MEISNDNNKRKGLNNIFSTIGFCEEDRNSILKVSEMEKLPFITFVRRAALIEADRILKENKEDNS